MPVTLPFGVNFRQAEAFVAGADPAPNIWSNFATVTGGGSAAYSGAQQFGWTDTSASGIGVANRNSGNDHRLAGIVFAPSTATPANFEYRVDTGAGTFQLTLALGDAASTNGPHKIEVFDGANTTAVFSITTGGTTATGQFYDASNTLRTSAAAWISGNATAPVTITSSYLRIRIGGSSGQTTLAHFRLDAGVTYTYARPTSDITTQWTPSTGTDHFALIDETTANDSDFIYATAAGQTDEVRLASMSAPQAGTNLLINYRVQGISGSASVTLSLVCNTTVIATDTTRTGNGDYTLNVPSATWASVADWTNMRLRFVSA